jgi:hypothetical protein
MEYLPSSIPERMTQSKEDRLLSQLLAVELEVMQKQCNQRKSMLMTLSGERRFARLRKILCTISLLLPFLAYFFYSYAFHMLELSRLDTL